MGRRLRQNGEERNPAHIRATPTWGAFFQGAGAANFSAAFLSAGPLVLRLLPALTSAALLLAACAAPLPPTAGPRALPQRGAPINTAVMASPAQSFSAVLASVEPVADAVCREKRPDLNCDFLILVDTDPGKAPNAFHRLDPQTGRPVIGFTATLIAEARSADELAFVLGHEAGHHLAGHLPRQQRSAVAGAVLAGTLAALSGAGTEALEQATRIGATVGARSYSKEYELEADAIGTLIAWRAGFDPERGAAFFTRLPDPGNRFLGSHPPNAARIQTVLATMAAIRQGRIR